MLPPSSYLFIFIQLQLSAFSPHSPTPPQLNHLLPSPSPSHLVLPCVLYSSSCNLLSPLSPVHSPPATTRLFLTSMSLVIFCLLFSSVDYVSVKGEIIRYLSLTDQYVSLFFKISNFILYSSIFLLHFASFLFFFILYFKFYILTFFTLFLILILIISPPSALSKSFFFPLLIFFFPFLYLYSHSTFIIFVHYYLCYINLCSFLVDIAVVVEGYFC